MNTNDLIVGGVSAGLGAIICIAAVADSEWCFRFRPARFAAARWGRTGARVACVLVGLVLMAVGGMIACHFPAVWPWEEGA